MTNREVAPLHPFAGLAPALPEQDLEAVVGGQEKIDKVMPKNTGVVREDGQNGIPPQGHKH